MLFDIRRVIILLLFGRANDALLDLVVVNERPYWYIYVDGINKMRICT